MALEQQDSKKTSSFIGKLGWAFFWACAGAAGFAAFSFVLGAEQEMLFMAAVGFGSGLACGWPEDRPEPSEP